MVAKKTMLDMAQSVGAQSIIPTKQIVTFGAPDKPIQPSDPTKTKSPFKITNDTTFQLYGPTCVYYFDEEGDRHGTCNTYRFVKSDGNTDLACKESPLRGKFERMLWGYCEN